MAEHGQPLVIPQGEVAEPHVLVDQGQQLVHAGLLGWRHPHVKGTGQLDGDGVGVPGEIQTVIAPVPRHLDGHLLVAAAIEGPVVGEGHLFDDVQGISGEGIADVA